MLKLSKGLLRSRLLLTVGSNKTNSVITRQTMMTRRSFADGATIQRPANITKEERAALRAARKERAARLLQQQQQHGSAEVGASSSTTASGTITTTTTSRPANSIFMSRWMWYLGIAVPTGLVVWGVQDENSPPAKFSKLIGLTGLISSFADEMAKPAYDKLLPDWSQIPNVPHDIPVPHTLVLDLENTLVSSTWDRKYGWRHAKRPYVDKFLKELSQYYEIVLYSPSIEGVAEPVVFSLDKEGYIMHRLYRDATHFYNGVHVKDLDRLNRNINRMIVIDDDPAEVQFHPGNLIRVKPYTDATDRTDDTLLRLIPFLCEIAREGYDNIPALLRQYEGMDADEICDEQDRRVQQIKLDRERRSQHGLSGLVTRGAGLNLPAPELPAGTTASFSSTTTPQLTAKDIAGSAPVDDLSNAGGLTGWLNRKNKEKEEQQARKMEKWNQVLLAKQQKRKEEEEKAKER